MRTQRVDGLHLASGGDGDVLVVCVHGAMDRGAGFLRTLRRLDDVSWLTYDRRGYGRSRVDGADGIPFDRHVDDLGRLLDRVRTDDVRPVVVVGHSIGGTIAAAALTGRPDRADALVAFESPVPWEPWWPIIDPEGRRIEDDGPVIAVDRFMGRVVGTDVWDALPDATRRQRRAEGRTLVAELVSVRSRRAFEPSRITVPTFVTRGNPSDPARERAAAELVSALPDGRLRLLDGAPHVAHTTHPDEFAAVIAEAIDAAGSWRASDPKGE